jgi:hypothetical protein
MMKLLIGIVAVLFFLNSQSCAGKDKKPASKSVSSAKEHSFDSLNRSLPDSAINGNSGADLSTFANTGDTVENGSFTYLVENVSFRKKIKSDAIQEKATGVFLLVTLTFLNHDAQSHAIDRSLIKLIDAKNSAYECSAPASDILAMTGEKVICGKDCKPGESISGTMVFDVPSEAGKYRLKVSNGAWKENIREICLSKNADSLQIR